MQQGIFKKEQLARLQPATESIIAAVIYATSFTGSLLWGAGGWERIKEGNINISGIAIAIMVQIACTVVQWIFASKPFSLPYLTALGVSTTTTVAGYSMLASLIGAWLAPVIGGYAVAIGWALLAIVALYADVIPERRFVR